MTQLYLVLPMFKRLRHLVVVWDGRGDSGDSEAWWTKCFDRGLGWKGQTVSLSERATIISVSMQSARYRSGHPYDLGDLLDSDLALEMTNVQRERIHTALEKLGHSKV
jgi:hypothetical protein